MVTALSDRAVSAVRNTYLLLSLSLLFAAGTTSIAVLMGLPPIHWIISLVVLLALLFAIKAFNTSIVGVFLTFVFTGFCGFMAGPMVSHYLAMANGGLIVGGAFVSTAAIFLSLTAYAWISGKDFSFLGGFLFAGLIVIILAGIANLFLGLAVLHVVVSAAAVLIFSGYVLYDTSELVHNPNINYIDMTVALFLDIFNLFLNLLSLFGYTFGDD